MKNVRASIPIEDLRAKVQTPSIGYLRSKDDRQSNLRLDATLVFPVLKRGSIRLAASTGTIVRSGADFDTFSIAWQTAWVDKPKLKK